MGGDPDGNKVEMGNHKELLSLPRSQSCGLTQAAAKMGQFALWSLSTGGNLGLSKHGFFPPRAALWHHHLPSTPSKADIYMGCISTSTNYHYQWVIFEFLPSNQLELAIMSKMCRC